MNISVSHLYIYVFFFRVDGFQEAPLDIAMSKENGDAAVIALLVSKLDGGRHYSSGAGGGGGITTSSAAAAASAAGAAALAL